MPSLKLKFLLTRTLGISSRSNRHLELTDRSINVTGLLTLRKNSRRSLVFYDPGVYHSVSEVKLAQLNATQQDPLRRFVPHQQVSVIAEGIFYTKQAPRPYAARVSASSVLEPVCSAFFKTGHWYL